MRRLAQRLAGMAGRRLDDSAPFADLRLPDGSRCHAVLAPVSRPGTSISLRVPPARAFTLDELLDAGTLTPGGAELLQALVAARVAFLVSGGTGSGKTTLLAALLSLVDPAERLVLVEDASELRPDHPHVVALEGRPANVEGAGAIDLRTLVRQALRMRPDRLVVGEVRGAEVVDLLAALNTGHDGGCGTLHANSAVDVPARLEALALAAGPRSGGDPQPARLRGRRGRAPRARPRRRAAPGRDRGAAPRRRRARHDGPGRLAGRRSAPRRSRCGRAGAGARPMTGLAVLAAVSAAAALALLAPVRPRLPTLPAAMPRRPGPMSILVLLPLLFWLPSRWLVPTVVGAGALGVTWLLWLRRRERRLAQVTGGRVLEACEHLASELASGQPPGPPWHERPTTGRCSHPWPRRSGSGPTCRRPCARSRGRPGADDLRLLAAAWHVAHRTGQGLADAVDRVARQLVDARATRRVVDGELASARATARLVALLPVAALLMGSGVGGDPVGFLLRTPAGWLCLATGLAFGLAGLWWIEALARDADRGA